MVGSTVTAMYNADGSLRTYDTSTKISSLVMVSSGDISDSRYKQFVMYDPETSVMYMYSWDYISGGSTVTAMYNADGSLRTYDTSTKISSLVMVSSGDISDSRYKQFVMYDPETSVMYMYSWITLVVALLLLFCIMLTILLNCLNKIYRDTKSTRKRVPFVLLSFDCYIIK